MNVKEAISIAKSYIRDVYSEEQVSNLGLEETEYDNTLNCWYITVGFSRPWNTPRTPTQALLDQISASTGAVTSRKRVFKVVTVSDDGNVLAMKNRQVADAEA